MRTPMNKTTRTLTIAMLMLATSGCATAPLAASEQEMAEAEQGMPPTFKRALVIGGALLVGALLINEAEDNVEDAVRSVASP